MNIKPGFSGSVIDALTLKVQAMEPIDCSVALVFDEMSIKQGLVYNEGSESVEGFEDFGDIGQTRCIANHTIAFMVRGLASKCKQPVGYFLSFGQIKAIILRSLTKQCIYKIDKTGLNVVALCVTKGLIIEVSFNNWKRLLLKNHILCMATNKSLYSMTLHICLKNVRNNF